MPVTDQETSRVMAQAKNRLSRYLLLCFVAMLVFGMSFAGVASAQTADSLESNDSIAEATDVGSGASYSGLSIDDSTDEDYYAVTVEEGEQISADIFFDDYEGDLDLEIQDSSGYYVAGSYSVSDDESAQYTAEESGTYYVRVYGFSGATADYDIDISTEQAETLAEDSLEPNDSLTSATDLGTGGSYDSLTIDDTTDLDYFAVEADAGDTITTDLFVSDTNGEIDLEIQDENGYYLDGFIGVESGGSQSASYTVSESGTYYVEIDGFDGATGQYDLDVSTEETSSSTGDSLEPNDDLSSATQLGSGGSYQGLEVSSYDDSDFFRVYADSGDTITADIFFDDTDGDVDLELQDSNGYYLDGSYSVSDDESVEYTVSESGYYYVEVYSFSGAPTSYDIDVSTDGSGSTGGDSLEPNDELSSATQLGTGGYYSGLSIDSDSDVDYFAVEADAGDTINADIYFSDANGDIDLELQDSDGFYLSGSASVSDDESVSYTVSQSGTYYVRVYPWSGAPNDYDINVTVSDGSLTGDSLEPNDDLSSATQLGSGGSYQGLEVSSETDSDFFRVYADSGDTITADIFFEHANGDVDMEIQDSNGYYLDGSYSVSDDESASYTVSESGYYYVEVYSFSGAPTSYDIDVSTDGSTDDDQITAGADLRSINFGETAAGTIDTSDPTIEGYYHEPVSFYGQSGTTVDISMTSETGDTYLVLQGPDGDYLTYDDDGGTDLNSEISGYELPSTGTYTIIATSYSGSSTFDYELSLSSSGSSSGGEVQTNEDLSLSANSTATAGGDMLVEFSLDNTGSSDQAVILQAGDGVDQLGSGYSISAHSDDGGNWRSSEGSWLFDSLSGEVNPSVTIDVPEDAEGTQVMTVVAESDDGNVSTTVVLDLDDIGIAQAADTDNNGELSDSEILAAIEAWQTDSTIEGTDTTVSDEDIITLISTWRSEGS